MFVLDLTNITVVDYAIAVLVYLWVFWGAYVLVMGIYRAHLNKKLTTFTLGLSIPFVAVGAILDVFANLTLATIIFVEPPKELLVTTRLTRHDNSETGGWRKDLAGYICTNLLDVFDPSGDHC